MRTVRRLYFYIMSMVSLEVIVWGVIGLARTTANMNALGGATGPLAGSLAEIIVGLPVFLFHWSVCQREAYKDLDERNTRERTVFLYGIMLGLLVPVVQNLLAIANRLALTIFGLNWSPLIGAGQSWSNNLIAVAVNLGAAAYIVRILQTDWHISPPTNTRPDVRRLYRFTWVAYSLALTILGVQQLLRFILFSPSDITQSVSYLMINGLTLVIVGTPLWITVWNSIQSCLDQQAERESMLRFVILYLLSLAGATFVLTSSGMVLAALLNWLFGQPQTLPKFFSDISAPLSTAIALGGVWSYYSHRLRLEMDLLPEQPQRGALRRLYSYILGAMGLAAAFFGMQQLLVFVVSLVTGQMIIGAGLRELLSTALASVIVGLPLWWSNWVPMQQDAARKDDTGDHTRRSITRKAYLYLALFACVVGSMISGGQGVFLLVSQLLGDRRPDFLQTVLDSFLTLLLFVFWLVYHIQVLRKDGRRAGQALTARHGRFPVLVLEPEDGIFAHDVVGELQRVAPGVPVAIQFLNKGIPDAESSTARLAILPAHLATHPTEALRLWLQDFKGKHMVVPEQDENWIWAGNTSRNRREIANQVAQAVRQMAEGQAVRFAPPMTTWTVAGYVLAGLFLFQLAGVVIVIVLTSLGR